eukprot:TRINITY_DN3340_c0_g1_i1.p2 TRINITY_DN3340_c0_g1~~TRINITY_DN3340_c0_g1_i1.p2  ORF type:complete len:196 (-),score=8.06 TRINITY_DN3340_c0_g1_i1:38-625(-)
MADPGQESIPYEPQGQPVYQMYDPNVAQPVPYAVPYAPGQPGPYAPQPGAYAPGQPGYAPQPGAYAPGQPGYAPQPVPYVPPQPMAYPVDPAYPAYTQPGYTETVVTQTTVTPAEETVVITPPTSGAASSLKWWVFGLSVWVFILLIDILLISMNVLSIIGAVIWLVIDLLLVGYYSYRVNQMVIEVYGRPCGCF